MGEKFRLQSSLTEADAAAKELGNAQAEGGGEPGPILIEHVEGTGSEGDVKTDICGRARE